VHSAQDRLLIRNLSKGQCHVLLACVGIFKPMHNEIAKLSWQFAGGNKLDRHALMLLMI
jgi:hypothetical protein